MKPAPFAYAAAASLEQALELLDQDEARPLAGGQSLVPMLNFRLAQPDLLVDLNPVEELAGIRVSDGTLLIGAMTRQAALLGSEPVAASWPLLTQAVAHVGHAAIRNRGTVGGSVAHADPAAELPAALSALDARLQLRSRGGARTLATGEFLQGALTTALEPGELLVGIEVPAPPPGARMAFLEHARTHGDFALAGAAVVFAPGRHAALALLGAAPVPVRVPAAERALLAGAEAAEVARIAVSEFEDDYRRALHGTLIRRALERVGT